MSKLGKDLKVIFLDHTQGTYEPIKCCVYGKCIKETDIAYTICSWDIEHENQGTVDYNREFFTILRSAILSEKVLR